MFKKKETKENTYRALHAAYPHDDEETFANRRELLIFLFTEYHLSSRVLLPFERAGRDFDAWPASKLDARAIATLDYKKYDKKKMKIAGTYGMQFVKMSCWPSDFFNEMPDEYLIKLNECYQKIVEAKNSFEEASNALKNRIAPMDVLLKRR